MKSIVLIDHWPDEGVVELGRSKKSCEADVLFLGVTEDLDHELERESGVANYWRRTGTRLSQVDGGRSLIARSKSLKHVVGHNEIYALFKQSSSEGIYGKSM